MSQAVRAETIEPTGRARTSIWPAAGRSAALPGLLACALVVGAAFARGGYFAGSWGWLTLSAAWAAGLAVILSTRAVVSSLGVATVGLWTLLAAWIALSGAWSVDPTQTSLEGQRILVYLAALLAALTLGARSHAGLVRGAWGAVTLVCCWSLLTRLVPDRFGAANSIGGNRLMEPIGYWNALGLFAAMGLLLALGLAAHGDRVLGRSLAAASTVPLASTLYFTFSRGAWLALAVGAVATTLVDRRRLVLLGTAAALAPWAAIAVAAGSRSKPLTTTTATFAESAHDGHRLLLAVLLLALAAAGVAALPRPALGERTRRGATVFLCALAALALIVVFATAGAPWTLVERGWHSFATAPTVSSSTNDLNRRLFHLYGSGRVVQWRVAWREAQAHPVLGSGAGTYERYWNRLRPVGGKVVDVHNLYLEVLAETGPVGLALLVLALGAPLLAAFLARGAPFTAVAVGAYVAYLAHAAVDWDWEIASVTLVALLCAGAILAATERRRELAGRLRTAAVAAAVLLAAAGVYTIAEQLALTRAAHAASRGDWPAAASSTRRASWLAPWSTQPWQQLAEAQLGARRFAAAAVSTREALALDRGDWQLWLDLARATDGATRANAIARAQTLNPRSPEVAGYVQQLQTLSEIGSSR